MEVAQVEETERLYRRLKKELKAWEKVSCSASFP